LVELQGRRLTDPPVLAAVRAAIPAAASADGASIPLKWGRGELLIAATQLSPALREARATFAQSRAAQVTARELQNPTASLASEYDLTRAGESPWLWGLATSLLADSFLGRPARMRIAEAGSRGAAADFRESLWTVRRELRTALLGVMVAQQRIALLEADSSLREELMRLATERVEAGESARDESLQTRLESVRAARALDEARASLVDFNFRLAGVIGVPADALSDLSPHWDGLDEAPVLEANGLADLRARALLSRPDLERAIADYDTRELELKQQSGAQYIQISTGPGYTWDHGIRKLTLGASLSLPVFNQNQGLIAEAMAAREVAGRHLLAVQATIYSDIESSTAAYSSALDSLRRARAQRDAAQSLAQAARASFESDASDRPTLLAAELNLSAERLASLDALERAWTALGLVEDALRMPVEGPEKQLTWPGSLDSPPPESL
jgi:outer membrane protein TolC